MEAAIITGSVSLLALAVSVTLAFVGYRKTYNNSVNLAQRNDRLARVNRQLSEFYGPLVALTNAADVAHRAFKEKYRGSEEFFGGRRKIQDWELKEWRTWVNQIFMPVNFKLLDIITGKTDLLEEDQVPQCLKDLCAHILTYKAVQNDWEENNFHFHTAQISFPKEVIYYSLKGFTKLKKEQKRLLATLHETQDENLEREASMELAMAAKKYPIAVFYREEDEAWVAEIPDLIYCSAQGSTTQQALKEVLIAQELWLEYAQENGSPIPEPTNYTGRITFSGGVVSSQ